ncbi:diaminopimelate epimerase [Bdellovibrio bacteriovorus]
MKNFLPVNITKMSGTGNTFALVDARDGSDWVGTEMNLGLSRPQFAKLVCDKVLGLATDGLLLIESGDKDFDFKWDFYNSDGSTAEMCGNAARCAALYCYENMEPAEKNSLKFATGAGLVTTQILGDGHVRVLMPEAKMVNPEQLLKIENKIEKFVLVNTGVPHLVQKIADLSSTLALKEMARAARHHQDLKPAGANVTFYSVDSENHIKAVTFERGVEDYTLACGTGAVAAAFVHAKANSQPKVIVQMPGGSLQVVFNEKEVHPLMTGEAVFVGDFKYNLEVVR